MMRTFAEAELALAESLPGYAPRPQQQRMASAVEQLFARNKGQALIQAGCGVGKSLGAVIPSIFATIMDYETGEPRPMRVLVVTATKALQEQYAGKDLPFLEDHLGYAFTWALLKGRSNYVCHAKMAEATSYDLPNIELLREELRSTSVSGDFEHLTTPVPEDKKYLLSMSADECPGKSNCPFAKECFAERAKDRAKASQIVITNTAMLMTELKINELSNGEVKMLGEYDGVVIDEAHEVGEIAASALSDQFRRQGMENLVTRAMNFMNEHAESLDSPSSQATAKLHGELNTAISEIWEHLEGLAQGEQVELKAAELMDHAEPYLTLVEGCKALFDHVHGTQIRFGEPLFQASRQQRIERMVLGFVEKLIELLTSQGLVRWVETETVRRGRQMVEVVTLRYSPIDVAPFLERNLWSRVPVALVSATLSVGGDFGYIQENLGLETATTLDVGTPFDYKSQALLFVPDSKQPHPVKKRTEWMSYAIMTTGQLVRQSGGGALLLYTSRKAMKDAYAMLAPMFEEQGITSLMQGEHGTNKEIARRFNDDENSVLFALKSFMTGVDFAGRTCRLVIVDKLPFPVPSDILFAARAAEVVKKYGSWADFNRLSIPMMTLTLIQAYGRAIRTVSDKAVIAILDPRLSSERYGRKIVGNLPNSPVTSNLAEVTGFFAA